METGSEMTLEGVRFQSTDRWLITSRRPSPSDYGDGPQGGRMTVQFSLPECQKINPEEYDRTMETMPRESDWAGSNLRA